MKLSISDALKIGRRSVRSTLTKQVLNSCKQATTEIEPINNIITFEDEQIVRSIKKKEKEVIKELMKRKTMEGYIVYVQGTRDNCSNRCNNIHKSESKYINEFNIPFKDKNKLRVIYEVVQKCNASIWISKANEVNFVIVNDSFMIMKASKGPNKREMKRFDKQNNLDFESIDSETLDIYEAKKILKFYRAKKESLKIISVKKFYSIYESYLKPFTVDYHRKCRVPILKDKENFFFSVVAFDDKKLRKYRKSIKCKLVTDYHEFSVNKNEKPDVHKIELNSPLIVPIFITDKERMYLHKNRSILYDNYLKTIEELKIPQKVQENILIPIPPKEYKNCLVCKKAYYDYIEHVKGKNHAKITNSEYYKEEYRAIDNLIEELESLSIEFEFNKECDSDLFIQQAISITENKDQSMDVSYTINDVLSINNIDVISRKKFEHEYNEINQDGLCINQSILYCAIDQSKENSDFIISHDFNEEIEQLIDDSSCYSFIIDHNYKFSKIEKCVMGISSESQRNCPV